MLDVHHCSNVSTHNLANVGTRDVANVVMREVVCVNLGPTAHAVLGKLQLLACAKCKCCLVPSATVMSHTLQDLTQAKCISPLAAANHSFTSHVLHVSGSANRGWW